MDRDWLASFGGHLRSTVSASVCKHLPDHVALPAFVASRVTKHTPSGSSWGAKRARRRHGHYAGRRTLSGTLAQLLAVPNASAKAFCRCSREGQGPCTRLSETGGLTLVTPGLPPRAVLDAQEFTNSVRFRLSCAGPTVPTVCATSNSGLLTTGLCTPRSSWSALGNAYTARDVSIFSPHALEYGQSTSPWPPRHVERSAHSVGQQKPHLLLPLPHARARGLPAPLPPVRLYILACVHRRSKRHGACLLLLPPRRVLPAVGATGQRVRVCQDTHTQKKNSTLSSQNVCNMKKTIYQS